MRQRHVNPTVARCQGTLSRDSLAQPATCPALSIVAKGQNPKTQTPKDKNPNPTTETKKKRPAKTAQNNKRRTDPKKPKHRRKHALTVKEPYLGHFSRAHRHREGRKLLGAFRPWLKLVNVDPRINKLQFLSCSVTLEEKGNQLFGAWTIFSGATQKKWKKNWCH